MIQFTNVSKNYPGHQALKDISVTIPDGDFVFLIGPSGAGKTTILRLLIRDILPSSGKIQLDDLELHKIPKSKIHHLRRKVGMIFQDFKILQDRTVYENVALALDILGRKPKDIKKEVINFGGPERVSRYELAERLCDIRGFNKNLLVKIKLDDVPQLPKVEDVSLNIDKMKSYGLEPKSLNEMIKEVLEKTY